MKKFIIASLLASFSALLFISGFFFYQKHTLAEKASARTLEPSGTVADEPQPMADEPADNGPRAIFPGDPVQAAPAVDPVRNTGEDLSLPEKSEEKKPDPPKISSAADCPGDVINLANWKQTLPVGKSKKPAEIMQPELANYVSKPYFSINPAKDGIVCRAPVNGVTTSNSGYPRSELREMTDNGKKLADWSTTSGTHTMILDQAITAVPKDKKHVVAGQIHDADDDVIVIRLEYPKLFVDINGKPGPTLDPAYVLGKRFTVKFVAANGQIKVYYNNNPAPAYTLAKKTSGCYFKAGAYTQSNCSKESDCSNNNFGEVVIYKLSVTH